MRFHVVLLRDHGDLNRDLSGRQIILIDGNSKVQALVETPQIGPGIYAVKEESESVWTGYEVSTEKRAVRFNVLKVSGYEDSKAVFIEGHLAWLCNPTLADDQS